MRRYLDLPMVRWLILLAFGAGVVFLTTVSGRFILLRLYQRVVGETAVGDAILHGTLFALLTALGYWALRRRLSFGRAFILAVVVGLILSAITEFSQSGTPGRTMTLSDLLANWLGVFVTATLVSYRRH
jgi:FtsH-binding integral membrane protein